MSASNLHPLFEQAVRPLSNPPLADTRLKENGSSVDYTITGATLDCVLNAVRGLFREFAPEGYGTHVRSVRLEGYTKYVAIVTRSRSCE